MTITPRKLLTGSARRIGRTLDRLGWERGSESVLGLAGRLTQGHRVGADLLRESARLAFAQGRQPLRHRAAYAARLALADRQLAAGSTGAAAASLSEAMQLAFHRVPHVDLLTSPLSDDPAGFTAPLHASTAARALGAPRGRAGTASTTAPKDRPLRLLVTTMRNANFLGLFLDHFRSRPDVELRFLDIGADPELLALSRGVPRQIERAFGGRRDYDAALEAALRPHLDWADTVFVEWCVDAAALLSMVDPRDTRVVVRLHRYEAFTQWPHLLDVSRIDDMVFIADHMREMTVRVLPRLLDPDGPRLHTLHNAVDLAGFARPKPDSARFQVGLVGMKQIAKDPCWALEVIRRLRERDKRYRLLLVGDGIPAGLSAATGRYVEQFERELAPLTASGAVRLHGPSDDVPGVLGDVGVILSSSVREGCHVGLMEGAASGAVPVVRDWPFVAGREFSARTVFPDDWVVGTPEQAVDRILATTGSEEVWRKTGDQASQHALAVWDWPVVSPDYDRLLLNR